MAWQRLAADVALERNPDGSFAYRTVVISVPRQSGKTTLLRAIAVQQMLAHARRELYYTAQTGKDARARWQQLVERIETDRVLRAKFEIRKSAGDSAIRHRRLRSKFGPFAPTAESLHGYTPHTVMIDEAFSQSELEGQMLMGAIKPSQQTLRDPQLYLVSTKGTAASTWFHGWVDAAAKGEPGIALIDYGADDETDIYDPETWETFHPVAGEPLWPLVRNAIADDAATMPRSEYERAYGNRPTLTAGHIIPPDLWRPLESDALVTAGDVTALSFEVSHDMTAATVLLSWVSKSGKYDGKLEHRILRREAGTEWLADSVQELEAQLRPDVVCADDYAGNRATTAELERRGVTVETTNGSELGPAWSRWLTRIRTGRLGHDGTDEFWTAAGGIVTRLVGDSTAPSRRNSAGDISPAIAGMVAGYKLEDHRAPLGKPVIRLPGE